MIHFFMPRNDLFYILQLPILWLLLQSQYQVAFHNYLSCHTRNQNVHSALLDDQVLPLLDSFTAADSE